MGWIYLAQDRIQNAAAEFLELPNNYWLLK
jgi:hypothetical protein